MGFLSGLSIKAIVIIAVILGLGGWGFYKDHQVNKAKTELVTAIKQRDEAASARDIAIEANKTATAIIAVLQQEKIDIQTTLNNLALDRQKNQKALADLTAAINAQKNNPENKVALSPVLKYTVDAIQKKRQAKVAP